MSQVGGCFGKDQQAPQFVTDALASHAPQGLTIASDQDIGFRVQREIQLSSEAHSSQTTEGIAADTGLRHRAQEACLQIIEAIAVIDDLIGRTDVGCQSVDSKVPVCQIGSQIRAAKSSHIHHEPVSAFIVENRPSCAACLVQGMIGTTAVVCQPLCHPQTVTVHSHVQVNDRAAQ